MTIDEKIRERSVKQPPAGFYAVLMGVTKVLNLIEPDGACQVYSTPLL